MAYNSDKAQRNEVAPKGPTPKPSKRELDEAIFIVLAGAHEHTIRGSVLTDKWEKIVKWLIGGMVLMSGVMVFITTEGVS